MRRRILIWLSSMGLVIALGAMLLGGAALAQDDSTTTLGDSFFERLAAKLGITSDELETAVREAGSETIDEALANGEITQEQADALQERLDSASGYETLRGFGRGHGPRGFGIGCDISLDTVATTLGITTDELETALADGSTLSEVIEANGKTVADVVDALVVEAEARLAEAVTAGDITQAQADELLAELPDRLTEAIENGFIGGPGRHHRWDLDDDASDDTTTEETGTPTI